MNVEQDFTRACSKCRTRPRRISAGRVQTDCAECHAEEMRRRRGPPKGMSVGAKTARSKKGWRSRNARKLALATKFSAP